jgi:hypothetical protein
MPPATLPKPEDFRFNPTTNTFAMDARSLKLMALHFKDSTPTAMGLYDLAWNPNKYVRGFEQALEYLKWTWPEVIWGGHNLEMARLFWAVGQITKE